MQVDHSDTRTPGRDNRSQRFVHRSVHTSVAYNRAWIREKFDRGPVKARVSRDHRRDFLDAVRSRKECIAPAETAHRSITPGHLGLLSQTLGRRIRWNAESESVIDDAEADSMLKRLSYRKPWSLT